ncbi:lipoyl(octanoyl) transferase LipB [soil metagenome]
MTSDAPSRPAPAPLLRAEWLGRIGYDEGWSRQRALFAERVEGRIPDTLLLLEHPPTYTLGRRSVREDLVYDETQRSALGIEVFEVDRGGRATCHAPGQLVGYLIVALGQRYDVLGYLRRIEQAIILTAADLGVTATTDPEHTGVWVGRTKLCAIGVKVTRGVTMHGFALNVTTDLEYFEGIVPCGIADRGVTSIAAQTGTPYDLADVAALAARRLATVLGRRLEWAGAEGPAERADALVAH